MRKQDWRWRLRVWQCVVCLTALVSLWGCAGPNTEGQGAGTAYHQPSSGLPPSSSGLPTSVQDAMDAERFAIPNELEKRLQRQTRDSCRVAVQARPDPRLLAQGHYEDPLAKLERRMLVAALLWVFDVSRDPAPKQLEHRKQLMLPGLDSVSTPVPVAEPPAVTIMDENGKEYTKGFVFGAASGAVPLAAQTVDVGIEMKLLPKGSYWARVGRACGEIAVGTGQIILGCVGLSAGATMTGTGGGAPAGIVVMAGSATLALNGCATASHGIGALEQVLREGKPVPDQSAAPAPAPKPAPKQPPVAAEAPKTTPAAQATPTPAQAEVGVKPKGAKRGPKTDPNEPHNAAINKEIEKLRAQGNKIIAGGDNPEKVVKTIGGLKDSRRPDIIYITPDGQRRGRNVGKTNADGTPLKREKEALDDLNKYGDTPTDFVPYDR